MQGVLRKMQKRSDDPESEFSSRLKHERQDLGISQAELAERARQYGMDVHSTAITRIEAGKRGVSLNEFFSLSLALGYQPEEMIASLRQQVEIGAGLVAEMHRMSEQPRSPADEAKTLAFLSNMLTESITRLQQRLETGTEDLDPAIEESFDRINDSF